MFPAPGVLRIAANDVAFAVGPVAVVAVIGAGHLAHPIVKLLGLVLFRVAGQIESQPSEMRNGLRGVRRRAVVIREEEERAAV